MRRFAGKLRIARKDPAALLPRPDGNGMQPAPHGDVAHGGHQPRLAHLPAEIGDTPTREWGAVQELLRRAAAYTLPYFQVQRAKMILLAADGLPRPMTNEWRERIHQADNTLPYLLN
jgi:hypothetical protein